VALYGVVRYILVGMRGKHVVTKSVNNIELRVALDIVTEYANNRLLFSITRFAYMK